MIRAKICGIQRIEDALVAAAAGADFIGLVFVPERRRRLAVDVAAKIVADLRDRCSNAPDVDGLFADQPFEEVCQIIATCGIQFAQLCGRESPEYCNLVQQETGAKVIKVLHVAGSKDISQSVNDLETLLLSYQEAGCYITLDRLVEGLQGGTGQSFDWEVAARLSRKGYEFLLAGGLTPDNVAEAVAQVRPWGVDVSSGVETGGEKDPAKIHAFINNARAIV